MKWLLLGFSPTARVNAKIKWPRRSPELKKKLRPADLMELRTKPLKNLLEAEKQFFSGGISCKDDFALKSFLNSVLFG